MVGLSFTSRVKRSKRTRMQGAVGAEGEMPSSTPLDFTLTSCLKLLNVGPRRFENLRGLAA